MLSSELNQARLRADRWNSEQAQKDRAFRDLRSQVDDLSEALSAKDGQLAVLKVRLDEADQLLKSRNAALEEAQRETSRYPAAVNPRERLSACVSDLLSPLESCRTTQRAAA